MLEDPYHITTLRSPLTRNLAMKFDDINDEAMHAMKENLDTSKGSGSTYRHCPV
jgi:hypothetical protein